MLKHFTLLFIIISLGLTLKAQKILEFDALTVEDGFTSNRANVIIQDKKGFIWIGTWNGLNRYDGYGCKVYKPRLDDSLSLSDREITALLEDHSGNIWIGTSFGLNKLNPVDGYLKKFPFNHRIISLCEDENGSIWIGTWQDGLYELDVLKGIIKHHFGSSTISDMLIDASGNFWLATYEGLVNFDRTTLTHQRFKPTGTNNQLTLGNSVVTSLAMSENGTVWVGTWGGGLYKIIEVKDKNPFRFIKFTKESNGDKSLSSDNIYKLYADHYGNLWIGTWDNGLCLLDSSQADLNPESTELISYKSDLLNPFTLSGDNITALFVDDSGVLWVGSTKLNKANIMGNGFVRYNTSYFKDKKYIQNNVRSFASDKEDLWIGMLDNLSHYRKVDDQYQYVSSNFNLRYKFNGSERNAQSILSLLRTEDGLWIGTDDAGLLYVRNSGLEDLTNANFDFYNTNTIPALSGNKITVLEKSAKYPNTFWLGTMENGFSKCVYKNNSLTVKSYRANSNINSISNNNIRDIKEDQDGIIWIATQFGLNRFNPTTEEFMRCLNYPAKDNTINDNIINSLYADQEGNIWVGTNKGLNKIDSSQTLGDSQFVFKHFHGFGWMDYDLITSILPGDSKDLWICSSNGMISFDPVSEVIKQELYPQIYQQITVERNTSIRDKFGNLIFGGISGFMVMNPENLSKKSIAPHVCFTDLYIHNEKVEIGSSLEDSNILNRDVPYANSLKLSYKDNMFTVMFSAMDYKNPRENKYMYMLENYDDKWNDVGNRNSAIYTGVPPGKYVLKVKASNSEGIWSNEATLLDIRIIPPFWLSVYAFVLYAILIIIVLYFFQKYSVIKVKEKSKLELEHLQFEKEHEINEMKSLFFTNITHEFRTPLTLILGPIDEILKGKSLNPDLKGKIELMRRNASRLLRLVNQVIEFRKVEKSKVSLELQLTNVNTLASNIFESFQNMASMKRIKYDLRIIDDVSLAWLDADKVEKVIYNLISNAFKFTENDGEIVVRVGSTLIDNEDCILLEVEDSGIGIPEDKSHRIFERFYQVNPKKGQSTGGIGLFMAKEFVDLHRGKITFTSKKDEGTCFKIIIPKDIRKYLPDDVVIYDNKENEFLEGAVASINRADRATTQSCKRSEKPVVLLVEDDNDMNMFIKNSLIHEFKVVNCYNGLEALELLDKYDVDLIISDIMMPQMDGFELLEKLNSNINTSHIPIVFLTAKTNQEDELSGLKMGAVDYIHKPFNMESLRLKMVNLIESRIKVQKRIKKDLILKPEQIELTSLDEIFLKQAVEVLNRNLDNENFDIETFARELKMGTNMLYRKIKALTGETAKEFIRNYRLKASANLLIQQKRSISEINYMVGFTSPSYFTKCFKEYFGYTPSEYMKKYGSGEG
ncbi:two-component regulator propeller domain-containing protein [Saccharicrinis sp. FJH2]|uniref:hybrid sensor histidine kinase/response regulator transcription factor n=1 Tax=Saccharicrinis sp. FJH65 TaxID=3344659 RepID=UPI0035F4218C